MKNFIAILLLLFIVSSVFAQKKSSSHRHNRNKHSTGRSMVHSTSSHKSSSSNHKPSRNTVSSTVSGGNSSAGKAIRTDIKPTAIPTASSKQTNTTPAVSREEIVSDGTVSCAGTTTENPEISDESASHHAPADVVYDYKSVYCNTNSYHLRRCNRRWFRYWYRYKAFDCNWTGSITFVNSTDTTLVLYIQQTDNDEIPSISTVQGSSLSNLQIYNNLEILPGDSLTFKMPCGGLVYEAVQKQNRRKVGNARHAMGWVRSTSDDLRVAIREEDLE